MNIKERAKRVLELAEKATDGPFDVDDWERTITAKGTWPPSFVVTSAKSHEDAPFAAECMNSAPALAEAVLSQAAEIERLRAVQIEVFKYGKVVDGRLTPDYQKGWNDAVLKLQDDILGEKAGELFAEHEEQLAENERLHEHAYCLEQRIERLREALDTAIEAVARFVTAAALENHDEHCAAMAGALEFVRQNRVVLRGAARAALEGKEPQS